MERERGRRRVLQVFEPPDGGVAENVMQLSLGLGGHGWDVTVAGPAGSQITECLRAADVSVVEMDALRRGYDSPRREAIALAGLVGILRRGRFDVVHCHSSKAGALGRVAAALVGLPSVYSPHCFGFVGEVGRLRRSAVAGAERILGRATSAIICACHDERRRALDAGVAPPARLRVVYHGCSPCPSPEIDGDLARFRGDGLLVVAVTALRSQKRIDVLIDAAPRLLREVSDARIAVVGNGPVRDQLVARAAGLGLLDGGRFTFLPFRPPSARFLHAADLFVLPSAWEGLPIALLEALACGRAQVATNVGGNPEVVTSETGILVPSGDPGALATALAELLRDDRRRRRAEAAARRRHRELFLLDRMVAETAGVYATVTG
ncbi:MAG: hypothetical protein QOE72_1909 [Chloroflexota bacterium]|nr:hypothetical protein [Chloroflexota bacterium]